MSQLIGEIRIPRSLLNEAAGEELAKLGSMVMERVDFDLKDETLPEAVPFRGCAGSDQLLFLLNKLAEMVRFGSEQGCISSFVPPDAHVSAEFTYVGDELVITVSFNKDAAEKAPEQVAEQAAAVAVQEEVAQPAAEPEVVEQATEAAPAVEAQGGAFDGAGASGNFEAPAQEEAQPVATEAVSAPAVETASDAGSSDSGSSSSDSSSSAGE